MMHEVVRKTAIVGRDRKEQVAERYVTEIVNCMYILADAGN